MRVKSFRKIVLAVLTIMLLVVCVSTTFAGATTTDRYSEKYELGAILLSLKPGSPSVETLLSGFEIESVRLLTPGSSSIVYYVKFVEKTEEIVQKAIITLKASSYVVAAEPNYIGQYLPVVDPTTQSTEPTTADDKLTKSYEPGAVLVSLKSGSPSVETLLFSFEIESVRLLTPGSSSIVYYVKFVEKTEEIVQNAITTLKASSYVVAAEPNYIGQYLPVVDPTTQSTEPTTADDKLTESYEPGAVVVSLKSGSPSVETLLSSFEIESVRLLTPGSSSIVYYVKFVEKTEEIVQKAITTLKASSYVVAAEPNYIGQYLPVVDPTIESTEGTQLATESSINDVVKGDADGDGSLSVVDATLIQRSLANLYFFDDKQILAADTDGDGSVSILDATLIQRKLAGFVVEW